MVYASHSGNSNLDPQQNILTLHYTREDCDVYHVVSPNSNFARSTDFKQHSEHVHSAQLVVQCNARSIAGAMLGAVQRKEHCRCNARSIAGATQVLWAPRFPSSYPAPAFSTYPSPILLPFSAPFPVLAPPPLDTGPTLLHNILTLAVPLCYMPSSPHS
ncbi:hypothetical protein PR048_012523 [Dryococelus australis]|uniref:Uncharacterized protein n=1 Tax=Dryococelus australis TaxID=614101 RepID=A0ABQ9HQ13_9NEOP|nr:hypothetical protein PR048_012523 [Dryococelus australis]